MKEMLTDGNVKKDRRFWKFTWRYGRLFGPFIAYYFLMVVKVDIGHHPAVWRLILMALSDNIIIIIWSQWHYDTRESLVRMRTGCITLLYRGRKGYKVQVQILRGYCSEDRISYIKEKFIFTPERMFCEAQRLQTETDDLFRHQTDWNRQTPTIVRRLWHVIISDWSIGVSCK